MKTADFERLLPKVLSWTEWKTASEIEREIARLVKEESGKEIDLPAPQIFMTLERGKQEGWIDSRSREVPKSLGNPRGIRHEFRRIGTRRPAQAPQKQEGPDLGGLVPVGA